MVIYCKCGNKLPFRCLLLSPGLSVADVECPYCTCHLHAGRQSRRIIWTGLVVGGLLAAISACGTYHFMGWSIIASIGILLIIAIVVAAILTGYSWLRNDFYINSQ
jgi:hypothetical protein